MSEPLRIYVLQFTALADVLHDVIKGTPMSPILLPGESPDTLVYYLLSALVILVKTPLNRGTFSEL